MKMKKEVSPIKTREDAIAFYKDGFYCTEAVVSSIINNFELDVPETTIKMASGFAAGVGGSKCLCGAVTGGVMMIGLLFGRSNQHDEAVNKTLLLSNELQAYFKDNNDKKVLCCSILTKDLDMAKGEHLEQCLRFTGLVAQKTAEIIIRENNLINIDLNQDN